MFDFTRTDDFFEQFNIKFEIANMYNVTGETSSGYTYSNGSVGDNFTLKIVKYGGANIDEYLDSSASYSKLDVSTIGSSNILSEDCGLDWYNQGIDSCTIGLHDDVTFDIGDGNVPIKAVFLCCDDYVMGYCINIKPFSVTNEVVFNDEVIFWDISRLNQ